MHGVHDLPVDVPVEVPLEDVVRDDLVEDEAAEDEDHEVLETVAPASSDDPATWEADPADRAEQAVPVPLDEDAYR